MVGLSGEHDYYFCLHIVTRVIAHCVIDDDAAHQVFNFNWVLIGKTVPRAKGNGMTEEMCNMK